MSTEVELATGPRSSFTDDDLHRMTEFDKIVKLSDSITSGKHPRIKVPPHLAASSTGTASPRSSFPTEQLPGAPSNVHAPTTTTAAQLKQGGGAGGRYSRDSLTERRANSQQSARTAAAASLPGLGFAPWEQASHALPASLGDVSQTEFSSRRARIEALVREQVGQRAKTRPDGTQGDFIVDDVLQRARELEQTFTPPPISISHDHNITNLGRTATRPGMKAVSSAVADSGDDQTFYSSNFSTPEFALTSRIPAESENDDVSMHDSSDYEPELDTVPSPKLPTQPLGAAETQRPPQQRMPAHPPISNQTPEEILSSLLGQNFDVNSLSRLLPSQTPLHQMNAQQPGTAGLSSWEDSPSGPSGRSGLTDPSRLSGPSGGPQSTDSGHGSSSESAYRRQAAAAAGPLPPSPFVRTHNLSPVAPQPAHISSLAAVAQLPLTAEEQQRAFRGTPAQVANLRREEVSQSSPDSSPLAAGRSADKKKGKKKISGKRKADPVATSPRIKLEPRSPSPILAPPARRPQKRQRQEVRPAREIVYRYDEGYSPTMQSGPYASAHPVREERGPVIYERIDGGRYAHPRDVAAAHPASLQRHDERRSYEGYETVLSGYAPQQVQPGLQHSARPPSAQYAVPPSQANLRPVRAASHALLEASSGYPIQAARPNYAGGFEASGGRLSARPEGFSRDRPRSPAMAPPSSRLQHITPPTGRIIRDELNREYFEPAMPDLRQQQTVVETVPYEPGIAYERPVSRQPHASVQRYGHVGSQAPPSGYGEEEIVYQRTSPTFGASRRVVTQPEYVTREYVGYPQREYSTRPPPQYSIAHGHLPERGAAVLDDTVPTRDYLTRASTARPSEAARYEMVPQPPQSHYVERVGSVRPPDSASMHPSYGFAPPTNGPRAYDGRVRGVPPPHMPEGLGYVDGHHDHEVIREYSARPEPHVVVQREYSARPRPAAPQYYAEQAPLAGGQPAQEYVYPDSSLPHEVYR